MNIDIQTVLDEYSSQIAELTKQIVFARAENAVLRKRLAEALNKNTNEDEKEE